MIDGAIKAARTGTGVAVAAPRGEGKTTVLRGICLYLVATKQARFPVMAGWTHRAATESFRIWLRMLHNSPEFAADYPELCQPFEESTHSSRIKGLVWADTFEGTGAEVRSTDKAIVLPGSIGAIAAASVQGDVKGLNVTLPNGEVLRPDILLLDDAQDPQRADNPTFVADVVDCIEKQWMCLAGPTSRITTMVACTVAAKGDVSEHFLSREGFVSVRIPRVTSWPEGWDEKGSQSRALWDAWHAVRLEGMKEGDGGAAGIAHYLANSKPMSDGMAVSWAERFDAARLDPDALYAAMVDFYHIGEAAFASEYQNQPLSQGVTVYALTSALIQSRVDKTRDLGTVPSWSKYTVSAIDLNPSYAFTWATTAFGEDSTPAVVAYGKHQSDIAATMSEASYRMAIAQECERVYNRIRALGYWTDLYVFDAGGRQFDGVTDACAALNAKFKRELIPSRAIAATGRNWKFYSQFGRTVVDSGRRHECHLCADVKGGRKINWVAWNADYWGEVSQVAWTAMPDTPGACTLPRGRHQEFSDQISRQQLVRKGVGLSGKMEWIWNDRERHLPHDFHDAMAMCHMGAAFGASIGGGMEPVRKQAFRKRSVRHVSI
jgi:hypothetical protein